MFPSDPNNPADPNSVPPINPEDQRTDPNPYGESPSPYGSNPQSNPYSSPLGGPQNQQPANPYGQQSSNPYAQQQPTNPYAQQPNPYGQQPNPYGQQQQNAYPPNNANQAWPPVPGQPFYGQQYGSYSVPVDANKILTYGIVAFFCFGIILGPIAWIQGTQAIKAMDAGQADPTERGKVQAGRICGAIAAALWLIRILFAVVSVLHR